MNEYRVRANIDGELREFDVQAETAIEACDQIELEHDVEVDDVRLIKQLSFSCRIRDGRR